jgi:DNA helicase-2/ATP-dependent DNA helicase PcrA
MIQREQLNELQQEAVDWQDGALLVLAGPGSGKTAVLTLRIAQLIHNTPDENFRILGLTFTVKAAGEMRDRISQLLTENNRRVHICTFHSFCTDLLRQHGSHLGLKPDFTVISDDKDRLALIKKLDVDSPEDTLKVIDKLFTYGLSTADLRQHAAQTQDDSYQNWATLFEQYLAALTAENQLDFGAMLHFTQQLLQTKPRIARQVRTVYRYICVDEFQDTNKAQYQVLQAIVNTEQPNLFVVADDDQIIYQWNGADPNRLEALKADYQPSVLQLPDNYRCPKEVVELANRLIQHNTSRITSKTPSISQSGQTGIIDLQSFPHFEAELVGLAQQLQTIPDRQREKCLVIARTNKLLTQAERQLKAAGINAEIVTRNQDFSSPLMLAIYYSLKLANASDSRSILNKLCAATTAALSNQIILSAEEIASKASMESTPLLRAFFEETCNHAQLKAFCEAGIRYLCDSLNFHAFVEDSIRYFDDLNQGETLESAENFPDYPADKENWQRIVTDVQRNYGDNLSLHVLLQEMDLTPKSKPLSRDCVRLQTVHTAKGTEFEHVYLIALAEEQFPTYFAIQQGNKSIEEERRNCFVAITRASSTLYLSYADKYFGWSKSPSRFLKEMGLLGE